VATMAPTRHCYGALPPHRMGDGQGAAAEQDQVGSWAEVLGESALTAIVLLSPTASNMYSPFLG